MAATLRDLRRLCTTFGPRVGLCYVTERRTGGNTTDEFNAHTVNTVDLQNSVAYPQQ